MQRLSPCPMPHAAYPKPLPRLRPCLWLCLRSVILARCVYCLSHGSNMKSIRDAKSCQSKSARETFSTEIYISLYSLSLSLALVPALCGVALDYAQHVCQIESELKMKFKVCPCKIDVNLKTLPKALRFNS